MFKFEPWPLSLRLQDIPMGGQLRYRCTAFISLSLGFFSCWICFNWCNLMCMDVTLALQRTTQDCRKQNQIAVRVGLELGSPTLQPLGHAASYKNPSPKLNQKPFPKPSIHVQWNPFNMDTNRMCHSIYINQVSVLSRFILEKNIWAFFRQDKRNCSLHMGVQD